MEFYGHDNIKGEKYIARTFENVLVENFILLLFFYLISLLLNISIKIVINYKDEMFVKTTFFHILDMILSYIDISYSFY